MFLILFTLLIGLILAYHFYKYQTHWKYVERFPGPKPLPIIGNGKDFGKNPVENQAKLFELWNRFGNDKFRVWMGYIPIIVITNPKDVEHVLASNTILKKSSLYDYLHNWLGDGLLTSFGVKWFKHRKMITPAFHFKILQDFHVVMKKNSRKFVQKLSEKAKTGEVFDVQDMVHYCTLDVICETAMGTEINAMDNHESKLVKAFQDMCYVVQRRTFDPLKMNPILYRFSEEYHIEKEALGILKSFTMDVIKNRHIGLEKSIANNNLQVNDNEQIGKRKQAFLDSLLLATIDGRPLNTQEIYEEVSTFMFEGHDTTTSGITFTIHLLSRHPEVQAKVYQEQVELLGSENLKDADPSFQDVQEMKYLDLVLKESLRIYPSVPLIGRETTEPTYLDGKLIPPHTSFMIYIMAMGYNEKNFPDPYKFDPERFRNRETANPFDYVPFSAGPRNCIGQKFALLEMKSVISNIVRNFEILPGSDESLNNGGYEKLDPKKSDPILAALLTLKSDNGIHIRLKTRE